jgi:hypothetical protein
VDKKNMLLKQLGKALLLDSSYCLRSVELGAKIRPFTNCGVGEDLKPMAPSPSSLTGDLSKVYAALEQPF